MTEAKVDRAFFAANFPSKELFGKKNSPSRTQGFHAIFDVWDAIPEYDYTSWLAYALATAWHETGATMLPVREGFKATDADAFAHVTAYCKAQGIPNYAARAANGHSYYGRGYVQLTHGFNYKSMGKRLGVGDRFYDVPDRVMDPTNAGRILLTGLIEGAFRPKAGTVMDYFTPGGQQWISARDMINGDKHKTPKWAGGATIGELVGGYGRAFQKALRLL